MYHNYPEPVFYHARFIVVKQTDAIINFTRIRKFLIVDIFFTKGENKSRMAIG
jgi:hypothetical protein